MAIILYFFDFEHIPYETKDELEVVNERIN